MQRKTITIDTGMLCKQASLCAGLCLLLAGMIPEADAQSGLRRIFTTPAVRAELDRRRLLASQPGTEVVAPVLPVPVIEDEFESDEPAPDTIYAVGGSMRRSDGNYTLWINEVPIDATDLPAHMELLQPYNQGQIRISNPATGASYVVKPGQVLNLTRGELLESYEYRARTAAATALRSVVDGDDADAEASAVDDDVSASPVNGASATDLIEQAQRVRSAPQ